MSPYVKPFGGIEFTAVPAGTVIRDEITGREETVTEDAVVFKRDQAFLTRAMLEKVRAAIARPNTQTIIVPRYRGEADASKGVRIEWPCPAWRLDWSHDGQDADIIAYQIEDACP